MTWRKLTTLHAVLKTNKVFIVGEFHRNGELEFIFRSSTSGYDLNYFIQTYNASIYPGEDLNQNAYKILAKKTSDLYCFCTDCHKNLMKSRKG
jgi:hypothetical protein